MENKEFKIEVPDGYEVDKENSTFVLIAPFKELKPYLYLHQKIGVNISLAPFKELKPRHLRQIRI